MIITQRKWFGKSYGLMGVKSNGVLVTPSEIVLFRLPLKIACAIQRFQHWFAFKKTINNE